MVSDSTSTEKHVLLREKKMVLVKIKCRQIGKLALTSDGKNQSVLQANFENRNLRISS